MNVPAAGTVLGPTDLVEIDQARIDAFAAATDDHQWIHVDPERAVAGPFGTTIAHGYLTLALLPALLDQVFEPDAGLTLNYGLNRVRFAAPAFDMPMCRWFRCPIVGSMCLSRRPPWP